MIDNHNFSKKLELPQPIKEKHEKYRRDAEERIKSDRLNKK